MRTALTGDSIGTKRESASPRQQGYTSYFLSPEELAALNEKYPKGKPKIKYGDHLHVNQYKNRQNRLSGH